MFECVFWFQALEERSNYLVVILCKDLQMGNLDEAMRLYVRTNTYLRREDAFFWQRLRYALPLRPMFTLPGGERDEDWCGVYALARARDAMYGNIQQRRWDLEQELADHHCQYHGPPEVEMEMQAAAPWVWGYLGRKLRHNRHLNNTKQAQNIETCGTMSPCCHNVWDRVTMLPY